MPKNIFPSAMVLLTIATVSSEAMAKDTGFVADFGLAGTFNVGQDPFIKARERTTGLEQNQLLDVTNAVGPYGMFGLRFARHFEAGAYFQSLEKRSFINLTQTTGTAGSASLSTYGLGAGFRLHFPVTNDFDGFVVGMGGLAASFFAHTTAVDDQTLADTKGGTGYWAGGGLGITKRIRESFGIYGQVQFNYAEVNFESLGKHVNRNIFISVGARWDQTWNLFQ